LCCRARSRQAPPPPPPAPAPPSALMPRSTTNCRTGRCWSWAASYTRRPSCCSHRGGGGGGDGGGGESLALPELVSTALHSCAATGDEGDASWDIKRQLLQGLVIAGGGSMLAGIEGRLEYELRHRSACRIPLKEAVRVLAPSARDESAWRGGAVLANLSTFGELWVTREEYEEHGAGVVRRKCYN
jgi:hypothetical protein